MRRWGGFSRGGAVRRLICGLLLLLGGLLLLLILLICPQTRSILLLLLQKHGLSCSLLLGMNKLLRKLGHDSLLHSNIVLIKRIGNGVGADCLLEEVIWNHNNLLRWRTWN